MDVRRIEVEPNADRVAVAPTADGESDHGSPGLSDIDAELARLAHLPVGEHVEVFAGIHRRLVAALAVSEGQMVTDHQAGPAGGHSGAHDDGRPPGR